MKNLNVKSWKKKGRLPDYVIACVGGGSNAIGAFSEYVAEEEVGLIGVEAAGHGWTPINTQRP